MRSVWPLFLIAEDPEPDPSVCTFAVKELGLLVHISALKIITSPLMTDEVDL